jgi:hypothetical protein
MITPLHVGKKTRMLGVVQEECREDLDTHHGSLSVPEEFDRIKFFGHHRCK